MRYGSPQLREALTGSFDCWWSCDVVYQDDVVLPDLPVSSVTTTEDSTAQIQYTGTLQIAYQDDVGNTIAPTNAQSVLSPFGSELDLYLNVSAGPFLERVLFGRFLVSSVPTVQTAWGAFQGRAYAKGDVLSVGFSDIFWRTQKNQFDKPTTPSQLASAWAEVAKLTGLPINTDGVADAPIPSSTTYQTNRLDAVYQMATILDAVPYITPSGAVGMRPNAWPLAVDTINGGDGGTLINLTRAMDPSNVFNVLVVRDQSGNPLASARVTEGPLRTSNPDGSASPFGRVPYYYSSPFITTAAQAQSYANANLARISNSRAQLVTISEPLNPLRDLGDVVTANRYAAGVLTETLVGRVQSIQRDGKTQTTTLAVTS